MDSVRIALVAAVILLLAAAVTFMVLWLTKSTDAATSTPSSVQHSLNVNGDLDLLAVTRAEGATHLRKLTVVDGRVMEDSRTPLKRSNATRYLDARIYARRLNDNDTDMAATDGIDVEPLGSTISYEDPEFTGGTQVQVALDDAAFTVAVVGKVVLPLDEDSSGNLRAKYRLVMHAVDASGPHTMTYYANEIFTVTQNTYTATFSDVRLTVGAGNFTVNGGGGDDVDVVVDAALLRSLPHNSSTEQELTFSVYNSDGTAENVSATLNPTAYDDETGDITLTLSGLKTMTLAGANTAIFLKLFVGDFSANTAYAVSHSSTVEQSSISSGTTLSMSQLSTTVDFGSVSGDSAEFEFEIPDVRSYLSGTTTQMIARLAASTQSNFSSEVITADADGVSAAEVTVGASAGDNWTLKYTAAAGNALSGLSTISGGSAFSTALYFRLQILDTNAANAVVMTGSQNGGAVDLLNDANVELIFDTNGSLRPVFRSQFVVNVMNPNLGGPVADSSYVSIVSVSDFQTKPDEQFDAGASVDGYTPTTSGTAEFSIDNVSGTTSYSMRVYNHATESSVTLADLMYPFAVSAMDLVNINVTYTDDVPHGKLIFLPFYITVDGAAVTNGTIRLYDAIGAQDLFSASIVNGYAIMRADRDSLNALPNTTLHVDDGVNPEFNLGDSSVQLGSSNLSSDTVFSQSRVNLTLTTV